MHHTVFEKWLLCEEQCFGSFTCHYFFLCFGYCFFGCGYYYIVPEIIDSLTQLLDKLPEWGDALISYINTIAAKHPELQLDYLIKSISNA